MVIHMNRRQFLKALLATFSSLGLARLNSVLAQAPDDPLPPSVFLPLIAHRPSLLGRVIHVHSSAATDWDYDSAQYYGRTQAVGVKGVNQSVVDAMLDRGVTELYGLPLGSLAEAWRLLTPNYAPGKLIAIKINLNNSFVCNSSIHAIDAIAQPVNAVVRSLKLRGVRSQDIVVYDAIRDFPDRLYQELEDNSIQIHDRRCRGHPTTWSSSDPYAKVSFSPPNGTPPNVRLSDTLVEAKYLINMPIMKGHPLAGVTLGFKNHFGSSNNPSGMHDYVRTSYNHIDDYNALVDLYSNPHIRKKTILTIGDGIYGSRQLHNTPPEPWKTFDDCSPCSLFFSVDPVAIDCVMHDLLKAERGSDQPQTSNVYLKLAAKAGLGVYEQGDPWCTPYGDGYSKISYRRITL